MRVRKKNKNKNTEKRQKNKNKINKQNFKRKRKRPIKKKEGWEKKRIIELYRIKEWLNNIEVTGKETE